MRDARGCQLGELALPRPATALLCARRDPSFFLGPHVLSCRRNKVEGTRPVDTGSGHPALQARLSGDGQGRGGGGAGWRHLYRPWHSWDGLRDRRGAADRPRDRAASARSPDGPWWGGQHLLDTT